MKTTKRNSRDFSQPVNEGLELVRNDARSIDRSIILSYLFLNYKEMFLLDAYDMFFEKEVCSMNKI